MACSILQEFVLQLFGCAAGKTQNCSERSCTFDSFHRNKGNFHEVGPKGKKSYGIACKVAHRKKNHMDSNPMNQTSSIGIIPKELNPPKFL